MRIDDNEKVLTGNSSLGPEEEDKIDGVPKLLVPSRKEGSFGGGGGGTGCSLEFFTKGGGGGKTGCGGEKMTIGESRKGLLEGLV